MSAVDDERLRQEREAFDLNKIQSIIWFWLQIVTSAVVLLVLVGVAGVSGYILLHGDRFSTVITGAAAAALFVDMVGLAAIYIRLVLSPTQRPGLTPVCGRPAGRAGRS